MKQSPEDLVDPGELMSSVIGVNVVETCRVQFEVFEDTTLVELDDTVTDLHLTFTDQALINATLVMCGAVRAMLRARGLPLPKELGHESN